MKSSKLPSFAKAIGGHVFGGLALFIAIVSTAFLYRTYAIVRRISAPGMDAETQRALHDIVSADHIYLGVLASALLVAYLFTAREVARPMRRLGQAIASWLESGRAEPIPFKSHIREIDLVIRLVLALYGKQDVRISELLELIADFDHDMKHPLLRIMLNASAFERGEMTKDEFLARTRKDVQIVTDALARHKELVRTYSPINGAPARRLGIRGRLRECVRTCERMAAHKSIALDCRLPDAPVSILAHRQKIDTILYNLVQNAVKYTPAEGRITITATTARVPAVPSRRGAVTATVPPSALATAERSETAEGRGASKLILHIDDTGPGVPPEERERIFEDEYRSPTTAHIPGSGHGLATVKALVDEYGGTCVCEPSPLGGARFTVTLPILVDQTAQRPSPLRAWILRHIPERKFAFFCIGSLPSIGTFLTVLGYRYLSPFLGNCVMFASVGVCAPALAIGFGKIGYEILYRHRVWRYLVRFIFIIIGVIAGAVFPGLYYAVLRFLT